MSRMFTVKTALTDYFQNCISESTLRQALREGRIPHARVGVRYIIREESLDAWMDKQEEKAMNKFEGSF